MTYQNDKLDNLYHWKDSLKPIPVTNIKELLLKIRQQVYKRKD